MTQVVELSGDEAALLRSLQKVIDKQMEYEKKLRDTAEQGDAAGVVLEDALNKVQEAADKSLKELLRELKTLGPDGAAAADAMKGHLQSAGKAGFRSMEDVLKSIREIDPAAADAALAAKTSLSEAANSVEQQFSDVLDELHALGPEGRRVAGELKKDLVAAGKMTEKSLDDVIAKLRLIDPEAADAASALKTKMAKGAEEASDSWSSFGDNVIDEIMGVAAAYVGISEAIQFTNEALEEHRRRVQEISEANRDLAVTQQTAIKNLQALKPEDRQRLLASAGTIAQNAGISDEKMVVAAMGSVASANFDNPDEILSIVEAAAKAERLSGENLADTAAAAGSIMKKTGINDPRVAIALAQSAQTASAVDDPSKLRASLPRALSAGVLNAPKQAPEEAARQAAAIWAHTTNLGEDAMGSSASTFTIDMLSRMDKFFSDIEHERIQARSKIELIDRKIHKGKDTEEDRYKKGKLEEFLKAAEGVADPGTIFGRLAILQGSDAIASQFAGESLFGEKQFQSALKQFMQAGSVGAKSLEIAHANIGASPEAFERMTSEIEKSTTQGAEAVLAESSKGIVSGLTSKLSDTSAMGTIRTAVDATIRATQSENWVVSALQQRMNFTGSMGSSASDALAQALDYLQLNKAELERGGVTEQEAAKIESIDLQIKRLFEFAENAAMTGGFDKGSAAAEARMLRARVGNPFNVSDSKELLGQFERLAAILERIASSNEKMVAPAEATANNTTPQQPLVTLALGSDQP